MAAGTARGNEHFAARIQPSVDRDKGCGIKGLTVQIEIEGAPDSGGLLKDLAQHGVRELVHGGGLSWLASRQSLPA